MTASAIPAKSCQLDRNRPNHSTLVVVECILQLPCTRTLILRCGYQPRDHMLFGLAVQSMVSTKSAIFPEPQLVWSCPFIFGCRIVSPFTLRTGQGYDNTHALSRLFINPNSLIPQFLNLLLYDFTDDPGAHRATTLANRKTQLLLHRYRRDQLNCH
jgi:hypothetical protein